MKKILLSLLLISFHPILAQEPVCLDLDTAINRAIEASPLLSIAEAEIGIADADVVQAGLLPNPEFILEYNGDPAFHNDVDEPEILYGITQDIEIVGKRKIRKAVAASKQSRAEWELELARLDLNQSVTAAFISAYAAQEKLRLTEANTNVSHEMLQATSERVNVGKLSPTFKSRAILIHASNEIALSSAMRDFTTAKQELAALWGSCCPDFERLSFPFTDISSLCPPVNPCNENVLHPSVALWDAEIEAANYNMALQRLERTPDVSLSAGVVHEGGRFNDTGVFFGISFPIPIFDSNQAGVARACQEHYLAEENRRQALLEYQTMLINTYNELEIAYDAATLFQNEILKLAEEGYRAANEGFIHGKFDYLEVLEAKRTLFEVQQQYIDALTEYHLKKAEYEALLTTN
jgi:cobalt-zinc-cadmium efflux system outer membrane protein